MIQVEYDYRLVNVQAAIGVAQTGKFDFILKSKKFNALYRCDLQGIGDIKFQANGPSYWLFSFRKKRKVT